MTDRELMQQALEALDWAADCIEPRKPHNCDCPVCVASDALLQRLAQMSAPIEEWLMPGAVVPVDMETTAALVAEIKRVAAAERREWVGLTDEEQTQVAWSCGAMSADWLEFAKAIEAKLREKNT